MAHTAPLPHSRSACAPGLVAFAWPFAVSLAGRLRHSPAPSARHFFAMASPPQTPSSPLQAAFWDQRYREGRDGWELGQPAAALAQFLTGHPLAPLPPGRLLVPGCGRGHEARLLADRGFEVVGLDFSAEALREALRLHGTAGGALRWLQADLFDGPALAAAGLGAGAWRGCWSTPVSVPSIQPAAGLRADRGGTSGARWLAARAFLVPRPPRRSALWR